MKILFSTGHFGFLRNFDSTLRLLAEHGHRIHLVADRKDQTDGARLVKSLIDAHPTAFHFEVLSPSKQRLWYPMATALRSSLDYWRYLRPEYDHSPGLRGRAEKQAPRAAVAVARIPGLGSRLGLGALGAAAHAIDRAIPVRPEVEALLDRLRPDVL